MKRADFLRFSLAGISTGLILPACSKQHSGVNTTNAAMAGGVFYTSQAPGRWSEKVDGHLPKMEVEKQNDTVIVQVVNTHPMSEYNHYIVKHQLLDANFNYIDEKIFDPNVDEPTSAFTLKGYSGTLYALSFCNLHDVWLNEVVI